MPFFFVVFFCLLFGVALARLDDAVFFSHNRFTMLRVSPFNRSFLSTYLLLEAFVWSSLAYSAIVHGKLFDYEFTDTQEFVDAINAGDNWYYQLMFGDLNLTNIGRVDQRFIQGGVRCCSLNHSKWQLVLLTEKLKPSLPPQRNVTHSTRFSYSFSSHISYWQHFFSSECQR